MPDIPGDSTTAATISVGGVVTGTLETPGDHDWFRITLTAGQQITILLNGVSLEDPYLRIRNSNGTILFENDDISSGIDRDSRITFTAPTSGTFYIDAGAWEDGYTGDYQLRVMNYTPPPLWTYDQIADQLTSGYWGGTTHRFNVSPGGQITVNLTGLTAEGRTLAVAALQTWTDVIGINFVQVSSGGQIVFDDNEEGAFAESSYSAGFITSSRVNIDTAWIADYGTGLNTYSFQTYIHEIGHALGLGHAGDYNGDATYANDALYANDSWATTVMSYFSQTENSYFSGLGFARNYVTTPMIADIVAMQDLYGLSTTTRAGNTTYGAGWSTSMGALCIFDSGGIDTIDVSSLAGGHRVDLNPGTFSNILGEVGNVSIALGVTIENATGGNSDDVLVGNSAYNVLTGNGGFDQIFGGAGDDTIIGGAGSDQFTGGAGNDTYRGTLAEFGWDRIYDFAAGDRIIITDANLSTFVFTSVDNNSAILYGNRTLYLSGGEPISGDIVASAAVGGGVQLTIGQAVVVNDVRNDFNGDGRSDLLLRNDNGGVTNWLSTASGGWTDNAANGATGAPISWHIAGTGDFNGDGRDDVVWRNDNGAISNWLATPLGGWSDNSSNGGTSAPTSWQIVGTGDFNGDGRDDILFRNSNGAITNWTSTASGSWVDNAFNGASSAPTSWHVAGVGDFNGDGRDDIVWRNDSGAISNWLATASGGWIDNAANGATSAPTSWHIVGTGDFNGDGRDDLLLRNNNGAITNWVATASGGWIDNAANGATSAPTSWQVAGIGDFNGDGRDDIVWRNSNGAISNWLATANGGWIDNYANGATSAPVSWHIQPDPLWF